jgi:hypothetical protein
MPYMPHSATSSVSGDDTSTTVTWNSGVRTTQWLMWVNTLWHDGSQKPVTPGQLLALSCSWRATATTMEEEGRVLEEGEEAGRVFEEGEEGGRVVEGGREGFYFLEVSSHPYYYRGV